MPARDEERARQILKAMNKLEHRQYRKPTYGWMILLMALALVAAIVLVIVTNKERFGFIWNHLVRPDSLPGG
jgi:FtsH-binding integral membrane protein